MASLLSLLLVVKVLAAGGGDRELTNVLPVVINAPQGRKTSQLQVLLPQLQLLQPLLQQQAQLVTPDAIFNASVVTPASSGCIPAMASKNSISGS